METTLKVTVLDYTPEFEQNIVRGARLCYSSCSIDDLKEKVTKEEAERFLNMILEVGHGSILEHSSITFGIEGVSRSLTHQLVRHRIGCSYSQKSQRYVNEANFDYIVPNEIRNNEVAYEHFIKTMEADQEAYNNVYHSLMVGYARDFYINLYNNGDCNASDTVLKDGNIIIELLKSQHPADYKKLSKKAGENARSVLPNACETKIQVTMNVRALFNFFKERLCNRAQDEIREMAYQMWLECMKISPIIFKHAVPTCVYDKCKEGNMCCGKQQEVKRKFTPVRHFYVINSDGTRSEKKISELKVGNIIEIYEPDNKTIVTSKGYSRYKVIGEYNEGKIDVDLIDKNGNVVEKIITKDN